MFVLVSERLSELLANLDGVWSLNGQMVVFYRRISSCLILQGKTLRLPMTTFTNQFRISLPLLMLRNLSQCLVHPITNEFFEFFDFVFFVFFSLSDYHSLNFF